LLTEKIITANYGDDTVSIIDNIEPLKIHTINLRDLVLSSNCDFDMQVKNKIGPTSLLMDNYNNLLVINSYDDSLFKIDLNKNRLLGTIKVGRCPTLIKLYNDILFVLNSDSNSLSIIEKENLVPLEFIKMSGKPTDMEVHTKERILFITNSNSHSLSIIDLSSGKMENIRLSSEPLKILIEDNIIFIMCFLNNGFPNYSKLFALEMIDYRIIWSIRIKGLYSDFIKLKRQDYFYLIDSENGLVCGLDIKSHIIDKKIYLGGLPSRIVYDKKRKLYINDLLNNEIIIIDILNNSRIERKIRVGREPQDIFLL